nr:hypothetical protein [Frankia gtarii]
MAQGGEGARQQREQVVDVDVAADLVVPLGALEKGSQGLAETSCGVGRGGV